MPDSSLQTKPATGKTASCRLSPAHNLAIRPVFQTTNRNYKNAILSTISIIACPSQNSICSLQIYGGKETIFNPNHQILLHSLWQLADFHCGSWLDFIVAVSRKFPFAQTGSFKAQLTTDN